MFIKDPNAGGIIPTCKVQYHMFVFDNVWLLLYKLPFKQLACKYNVCNTYNEPSVDGLVPIQYM